jgi:hypothetical protein
MDASELLREIERVFPPVPKPIGSALSFHEVDCAHCDYLRRDLEAYTSKFLPAKAFRTLYGEMSCLSADGWRWVLPSYLPFCIAQDTSYDPIETEFLIYNLSPSSDHDADARKELSALNYEQIECLVHFLHWCQSDPHWSEYCSTEIETGLVFLRSLSGDEA